MDPNTALLDWATSVSTTDRTPPARPLLQPGQIEQKWFTALFGEEKDVDRMKKLLAELDGADHDRRLDIFADLEFMCELTHNANDLAKIGGLETVFGFVVADDHDDVQVAALNLLGICIPNNPDFCEALMQAEGRFAALYGLFRDGRSETVRSKAFWAISGLVKAQPGAFAVFVSNAAYVGSLLATLSDTATAGVRILRRAVNLVDFIEVQQPRVLGSDLPRLLTGCLQAVDDIDCCEQIVLLLRKLHDRGEELGDRALPTLMAIRNRVQVDRDSDHDPEVLLTALEELIASLKS